MKQMKLADGRVIDLHDARELWKEAKTLREHGIDPADRKRAVKQTRREAIEKTGVYTVAHMIAHFYAERLAKTKRGRERLRTLHVDVIPSLGERAAAQVTRGEIQALVDKVAERAPRVAVMMLGDLRAAYEHAISRERTPDQNPCARVKTGVRLKARDRALDDAELKVLFAFLRGDASKLSKSMRDGMKLELLTAARQGEIFTMPWRELDLDAAIWRLPASRTKNGRTHTVPLSPQAVNLFKARQEITGGSVWVFPQPKDDARPIDPHGIVWALCQVREQIGLAQFTMHDLRRTALTGVARLGYSRQVQDRIANHVDGSVSAIYDRHSYDAEAREALFALGAHFERLGL